MMKKMRKIILVVAIAMISVASYAQQDRSPADRVAKEKARVLEKITDLNEDQKLIMDQIYKEYEEALTAAHSEGDRQSMRTKMPELREKKDEAMEDLLSAEQYATYKEINQRKKGKRKPNE